jgi:hypothetical protein
MKKVITTLFALCILLTDTLLAQTCSILNESSLELPLAGASLPKQETTDLLSNELSPDGSLRFGASGSFSNLEGIEMHYAADGSPRFVRRAAGWNAMGTGMNDSVNAIAISGTDVYVGGSFTQAGGNAASYIAKWNGSTWSALGSGVNSSVYALTVSGTDVYVGGAFTNAGGSTANRIAKWSGSTSTWSALGSGVDNDVLAIAVSGTDVYAGGVFTMAGGSAASRIAKWSGSTSTWSVLGSPTNGVGGSVYAIAISGSDVYVGGVFTTAGGNAANRIAKWSGGVWSTLGTGMNDSVNAIAVSGSDVYMGGVFTTAGGIAASRIAKWSGGVWSALGSGVSDNVSAIAVSGSNVYVGGYFTQAGGSDASTIAKWNGSTWSALDIGVDNGVTAVAIGAGNAYIGGGFTQAGRAFDPNIVSPSQGNVEDGSTDGSSSMVSAITANYIVRWEDAALPISLVSTSATVSGQEATLKWQTASESSNERFVIEEQIGNTWKQVGEVKGAGTTTQVQNYTFAVANLSYGTHYFRLVQHDFNGSKTYSDVIQVQVELADQYFLSEAYPNPFNPSTTFTLAVATDQRVQIEVFDLTGRKVQTLHNGQLAGQTTHSFTFNGNGLASGKYLVRVTGEGFATTKIFTMVK